MLGRRLLSAGCAGVALACHIVLLTLFLNPTASLSGDGVALLVTLFLPYMVAGTAVLAVIGALGGLLFRSRAGRRPPVEGLPWFTTLTFLVTSASAGLYWTNLLSYRHSIPEEAVRGLAGSTLALAFAASMLIAVGVDALLFPFRGRGFSAALVVLSVAGSVVVPLALRPAPLAPQPAPRLYVDTFVPARRVVLIGVDGLGPDLVREGVARGALPAFEYLIRRGAHGPLGTLRPTEGPPVWTSIVTGTLPRTHGVKSFVTYRLAGSATVFELLPKGVLVSALEKMSLVTTAPVTSAARRRPALWNVLNAFSIEAGVVRLWATHPVERVRGFMLSPRLHPGVQDAAGLLHPPDLLPEVAAQVVAGEDLDGVFVNGFVDRSTSGPRDAPAHPATPLPAARVHFSGAEDGPAPRPAPTSAGRRVPERPAGPGALEANDEGAADAEDATLHRLLVDDALAPDLTYQRVGSVLRTAYDPPFFATYFYGLDVVGHTFLPYARPSLFGNVDAPSARRYGRVVERYAALVGEWTTDLVEHRRPSDVIILVSGYGMEPATLRDRLVALLTGRGSIGGTHERAPDGYFVALGEGIKPGAALHGASVVDVAPTILYLMGLPVARDMDGRVLTEILDEEYARANPLTFIPSYSAPEGVPVQVVEPVDTTTH